MKDKRKFDENLSTDFLDEPKKSRNNKKIKIEDFDNKIETDEEKEIFLENDNKKPNIYKREINYSNNKKTDTNVKKINPFIKFLFFIMIMLSLGFIGYTIYYGNDQINQTDMIINSALIFIICLFMILSFSKKKNIFMFFTSISMIGLISFNLLNSFGIIDLPQKSAMKDFTGKSITEAIKWADANNIEVEQTYENSDNTEEYHIISQSVLPNVLTSDIKNLEFIVSNGPDYNKEVTVPDMTSWNIDEAVDEIDELFLNNVNVDYLDSEDEERDIIMEQNRNGQMKRNEELKLKVSIGKSENLTPVDMIEMKNMSMFKATLWLKRNGIKYELDYQFSDKVKRNHVISQSIEKGKTVKPNDTVVKVTISKGKKIIVPDLKSMSVKEITNWIVENRLQVEFINKYDSKIKQGKIIDASNKKGDEIEEGTKIRIMVSKGQLKMKKFNDLQEFREWAKKYSIKYREEYIQDKDVEMGKIIKFSVEEGNIVNPEEEIIVYVSSGTNILVPNFVGKTKSDIQKSCNELGLNCTFYYAGLSSKEKDIAISQNKRAGSEVLKNTYVNIGLSSGKTNSNNNIDNSTSKPSYGGSSGGSSNPTPTPTPKPDCKTKTFYIQPTWIAINDPETTCNNVKNNNPGYTFHCNFINSDSGRKGQILNSGKLNGTTINSCNTITLDIKQN